MMRTVRAAAVAMLVAVSLAAMGASVSEPRLKAGHAAPDFTVKMVTGDARTLKLSSLRGKYVLLATMCKGCPSCTQDIATINAGHKRLAGDRFCVVGVVTGLDRSGVRDMVEHHNITFPIGCDEDSELLNLYGIPNHPTSFLIDPQGTIVSWSNGTETQFAEVENLLGADAGVNVAGRGDGPAPEVLLREAIAYYNAGELQKAYVRCNQTLEAEPDNVQALVLLGDLHRKINQPRKAIAAYQRALDCIDPEDYARAAAAYNRMANTCIGVGKYKDAAKVYRKAIKTIYDANYAVAFHAYLGMCYAKLDKRTEALEEFETFLKLYKQVDAGVQKRHAELYKHVETQRQQLKQSGGDSADAPESGAD